MRLTPLLIVTALFEAATGVVLLVWPTLILALLFGWRPLAPETLVLGRLAGAGALSIGVASWAATRDAVRPAPRRRRRAKDRGRARDAPGEPGHAIPAALG